MAKVILLFWENSFDHCSLALSHIYIGEKIAVENILRGGLTGGKIGSMVTEWRENRRTSLPSRCPRLHQFTTFIFTRVTVVTCG